MNVSVVSGKWLKVVVVAMFIALLTFAIGLGSKIWLAQAQTNDVVPLNNDPNAPTAGPHQCNIDNIAVFDNRIHVKCLSPVPSTSIRYFAASGDSEHMIATNRFLMLLNTAYALGKPVYVHYFGDSVDNIAGCNVGDCRTIEWMYIVP